MKFNHRTLAMDFAQSDLEAFLRGDLLANEIKSDMEFHSHFSNDSRQDAATIAAHLTVLLDLLRSMGKSFVDYTL